MFSLAGKVALVTGASRGIGRACALALAKAGATVVGTATSEAGAAAITQELRNPALYPEGAAPSKAEGLVLDVANREQTESLFEYIANQHGPLGILVNNAGITRDQLAMRMKDDDWDAVLDTNLSAVFRLARLAMKPMMKARCGRIISITSVVGSSGNPGQANYAAAKAGVSGMSRALARELGSRNITVNCVAPGFIQTDMTDALSEEQISKLQQNIPLGRLGHVQDVAAAVLYLASDAAAYVTGTTLHVNGGLWMG